MTSQHPAPAPGPAPDEPNTVAGAAPSYSRAGKEIQRLLAIMAALRNPDGGCPWDIEQNFETIAPYTIEEAYEVADAIARNDMGDLRDELGDLLFQSVFHAQMAAEDGAFDFADVVHAISDKMERRHPHVFDVQEVRSSAAQSAAWEDQKAQERAEKATRKDKPPGVLDDVPNTLPALMRAHKLGKRMQRVGFDWPDALSITAKVEEELEELRVEIEHGDHTRIAEELGDLLFTVAQVGRRLGIDPEEALRQGNRKVERRFRKLEEKAAAAGRGLSALSMDELEQYWQEAKVEVKS